MVTAYETGLHTEWDAATTANTPVAISPIRDLFTGKVDHIITDDAQNDPRFHFEGGVLARDLCGGVAQPAACTAQGRGPGDRCTVVLDPGDRDLSDH